MSASDSKITVVPVQSRRQLREFARFGRRLYKGCAYNVPELDSDVMDLFTPSRNSALEFCQAQTFLAVRGGRTVGRVAAIINAKANEAWGVKTVRFGWIDFEDDIEVSRALLDTVAQWGLRRGMNRLEGPFGFTDFDPEGMLTWGFDRMGTMATIYNWPYYPEHMCRLGLTESATWSEWLIPHSGIPEKISRLSDIVLSRNGLHVTDLSAAKSRLAVRYAHDIFHLVNESFSPLYGYSAFSEKQIDDFVRRYLPLIDKRLVCMVQDSEDNLVAAGFTIPSVAHALRKAGGHLFPLGWWHLLKAFRWKHSDTLEMLFMAVRPDYQNRGINAVPVARIMSAALGMGFMQAESNPELDTNTKMQSHWSYIEGTEIIKRRAVFYREI